MQKLKTLIAVLLVFTLLIPTISTDTAKAAVSDYYNAGENTYVNLALATINASTFDGSTEHEVKTILQIMAAMMGPAGFATLMEEIFEEYSIPDKITLRGIGELEWDQSTLLNKYQIVYGTTSDVAKLRTNDVKVVDGVEEYRFLGFDTFGNPYMNKDFPPDSLATTDVGKRNWLFEPWKHPSEIVNSVLPEITDFMLKENYTIERQIKWLEGIEDRYVISGQVKNNSGTARGNFDPNWPASKLVDYAVIQQPPIGINPGQATMWHRVYYSATSKSACETPTRASGRHTVYGYDYMTSSTKCYMDWYDTFVLAPEMDILNMFVQYWDDLKVNARWLQKPNNTTWANDGYTQPAGTPVIVYANVQSLMPRLHDTFAADLAKKYAETNQMLNYYEVNGEARVNAKVYFILDSTKEIIGIKPVELSDSTGPTTVWIDWKYPKKTDKVHVVVVPDFEQNPNFREYFLQNNVMTVDIKVAEGGNTTISGDGLDNIKINALIPQPGNGGKKPGEQINFVNVVQADLPTKYVEVSFNGGAKSNLIPLNATVSKSLNDLNKLDHVSVDATGAVTANKTYEKWEYISKTCFTSIFDEKGKQIGSSPYECGSNGWVTKNNPNHNTAKNAVDSLKSTNNEIKATVTVQGKTCNVTLVRGGDEKACTIVGKMPSTESFVMAEVKGSGITETTLKDNIDQIMMYPILSTPGNARTSTTTVEYHQLDPKTGNPTRNSESNPAKYGQQVRITLSSTAGLEQIENKYGYTVFRMYSEYANTSYGTGTKKNVPISSKLDISGNTPSVTYNGISKQASDNKTWTNDFENTAKSGSNMKYLYNVERTQKTTKGHTWYEYTTDWANCANCPDLDGVYKTKVTAEVETAWRTKKDHHWIVDLNKTKTSPIGYWPEHGTLPPLKDGVPTALSKGGKPQVVKPTFSYKFNHKTGGVGNKQITNAPNVYMFGTIVTNVATGS